MKYGWYRMCDVLGQYDRQCKSCIKPPYQNIANDLPSPVKVNLMTEWAVKQEIILAGEITWMKCGLCTKVCVP